MRAFFIILILAGTTAGGSSKSDHGRAIVEKMSARYDFSALTLFLKSVIRDNPALDKVPLASTKVEEKWRLEKIDPPSRMRSGDWVIWDKNEEGGGFDLYYQFDATHSVTIRAKRLAKDKFEFTSLSIEEWISLR